MLSVSHQLHPQLPADDAGGALQAFDRGAAVVGIEQTIDLRAACLHQLRHALLGDFFFFISLASWRAMTALIAAAVTSSRIPSSSSQLSKLEPMCGFFLDGLFTTTIVSPSISAGREPNLQRVPFATS